MGGKRQRRGFCGSRSRANEVAHRHVGGTSVALDSRVHMSGIPSEPPNRNAGGLEWPLCGSADCDWRKGGAGVVGGTSYSFPCDYQPHAATPHSGAVRSSRFPVPAEDRRLPRAAHIRGHHCTLHSRNGYGLKSWPQLAEEIAHAVRAHSSILDGEICCLQPDGTSNFNRLLCSGGTGRTFTRSMS